MGSATDDPYATLGVDPGATADEIKRAYRRAARRWHPDRNPDDPEAAERFKAVARAWEILGDPAKRATHDGRESGAHGVPADFVDATADAIERAQRWAEEVVVPHYASLYRGRGAEMAARWIQSLSDPDRPGRFSPTITLTGRWRARRWLRDAVVRFDDDGYYSGATSLILRKRGFIIGVSPASLWAAGYRGPHGIGGGDATELDDAIEALLLARYAQALCAGRFSPPDGDDAAAWEEAIVRARADDDRMVRADRNWRLVVALVAASIGFMLLSGWMQW